MPCRRCPCQNRGKLKRALLENELQSWFSRVAVAVHAGGIGGVGKTIFYRFVRTLVWEMSSKRFP